MQNNSVANRSINRVCNCAHECTHAHISPHIPTRIYMYTYLSVYVHRSKNRQQNMGTIRVLEGMKKRKTKSGGKRTDKSSGRILHEHETHIDARTSACMHILHIHMWSYTYKHISNGIAFKKNIVRDIRYERT
eukprot:GHVS01019758.1.p2 GENE.GHVS01019758.1~~GHVS01019758.1.p2  ORF type:complete len:133 (+),score=3.83 GHVS01019758.1:153-551(+)